MKKFVFLPILFLLPLLFLSNSAFASSNKAPKEASDGMESTNPKRKFHLSGGYNGNHLQYTELTKRTGAVLDEDYGRLKGFYVNAGYKNDRYIEWLQGSLFFEGYFQRYTALITYESNDLTFDDEHADVQRFGAKVGAYRELSKNAEVFGYIDIGERIWYRGQNRVIQGITDYAEKYWWTYLGLGLGIKYELFPKFTVGIEAEGMYSPPPLAGMHADLREGSTFELGMVLGADIKLPLKYNFLKNLSFDITPYFTYWEINKSNSVSITGIEYHEPYSRTYIKGLLVGLTWTF